ncbi:MAG: hypothetical protein ACK5ZV_13460 [bacterium]
MSEIGCLMAFFLIINASGCDREAPKVAASQSAREPGPASPVEGLADDQGEFVPTPDELAAVPGRYRLAINPISDGQRLHFLLDTATGSVWVGFIPKAGDVFSQMRQGVTDWIPVRVYPAPDVILPEPGRFSIESSFTYGADKFLLDSVSGSVWICAVDEKQNFVFEGQTVHRPAPSPSVPGDAAGKAPAEGKK